LILLYFFFGKKASEISKQFLKKTREYLKIFEKTLDQNQKRE